MMMFYEPPQQRSSSPEQQKRGMRRRTIQEPHGSHAGHNPIDGRLWRVEPKESEGKLTKRLLKALTVDMAGDLSVLARSRGFSGTIDASPPRPRDALLGSLSRGLQGISRLCHSVVSHPHGY
eukprot:1332488-Amorphochlora_amoeboformis.AAC.2